MIYPYTAALQITLAALSFVSVIYLWGRKKDHRADFLLDSYFNWFLFFFLYNILLILPLVIFDELNVATGIFFASAMIFLGLATWHAVRFILSFIIVAESRRRFFATLYLIGVLMAALLFFVFPEVPTGSPDRNWVFWYGNRTVALIYSAFMFIAGWTFAFGNLRSISALNSAILRSRALFYALAGFTLPFAAFFYFGVKEVRDLQIASAISIVGLTLFVLGNNFIGILLNRKA